MRNSGFSTNVVALHPLFLDLYIEQWNVGTCSLKKLLNVKAYTVLNLKPRAIFYIVFKWTYYIFIIFIAVSYYCGYISDLVFYLFL